MEPDLRFTVLPDGSSDRALVPIIDWTLRQHASSNFVVDGDWADLRRLPRPPKELHQRIETAVDLYPCDILFIHRDAEGRSSRPRLEEIESAFARAQLPAEVCFIPVVPVRMMEAWLLFDEVAIRRAASNPNGKTSVYLPDGGRAEALANPKDHLLEALRQASGLTGRRLQKLNVKQARALVADLIDDFSPLRRLEAFRRFEERVADVCRRQGWATP